jgi:hypothetical protein
MEAQMERQGAVNPYADLTSDEQAETVQAMWSALGVPNVTDWYVLFGSMGGVAYVLKTGNLEVRLGKNILNYAGIRNRLFAAGGPLMTEEKKPAGWDMQAWRLRCLAREVRA